MPHTSCTFISLQVLNACCNLRRESTCQRCTRLAGLLEWHLETGLPCLEGNGESHSQDYQAQPCTGLALKDCRKLLLTGASYSRNNSGGGDRHYAHRQGQQVEKTLGFMHMGSALIDAACTLVCRCLDVLPEGSCCPEPSMLFIVSSCKSHASKMASRLELGTTSDMKLSSYAGGKL